MFCKKGVLRNFAKFTGKHLCQRLRFLWHRYFPMNFVKFLRIPFLQSSSVAAFAVSLGFLVCCTYKDLVYFTKRVPGTSDTSATRTTRVRHECDMNAKRMARLRHECYTSDTSVTPVKNFDFCNNKSENKFSRENIFSHPILAIWQMKDYKERNNFILTTTFWKCIVPMPKCIWKVHHKNWTLQ